MTGAPGDGARAAFLPAAGHSPRHGLGLEVSESAGTQGHHSLVGPLEAALDTGDGDTVSGEWQSRQRGQRGARTPFSCRKTLGSRCEIGLFPLFSLGFSPLGVRLRPRFASEPSRLCFTVRGAPRAPVRTLHVPRPPPQGWRRGHKGGRPSGPTASLLLCPAVLTRLTWTWAVSPESSLAPAWGGFHRRHTADRTAHMHTCVCRDEHVQTHQPTHVCTCAHMHTEKCTHMCAYRQTHICRLLGGPLTNAG